MLNQFTDNSMPFYKFLFLACLSLSLNFLPMSAQDEDEEYEDEYEYEEDQKAVPAFRVGIGGMFNVPFEETFDLRYNNGLGLVLSFGYNFSPNFSLALNSGFLFWDGNEQVVNEQGAKSLFYYQVPVTIMPMYFFSRGGTYEVYAAVDAGIAYNSTNITRFRADAPNQEEKENKDGTAFVIAPVIGAQMPFADNLMLNANIRYNFVFGAQREIQNTVDLSYLGIYAGLVFEF
jgi:opacity protein-like surface antigen